LIHAKNKARGDAGFFIADAPSMDGAIAMLHMIRVSQRNPRNASGENKKTRAVPIRLNLDVAIAPAGSKTTLNRREPR